MTILFTLNKMQKKTAFLAVFFQNGGPEGIRTLDLCVANAALSQAVHKATRTPRQKFELFPERVNLSHNSEQKK